jgi:hypothetical protein
LLIEVMDDPDKPGTNASELFSLLGSLGYRPFVLDSGKLRDRCPGEQQSDYFFLDGDRARIIGR